MIPGSVPAGYQQLLDEDTTRVVIEMDTFNDDHRRYVRTLAADLGMPVEHLRQTLRLLDAHGLVTCGPVCNADDGRPAGSTWWLTQRGASLQEELAR